MYLDKVNLKETIKADCAIFQSMVNKDKLLHSYLYLEENSDSETSGLYGLVLNGHERKLMQSSKR